MTATAHAEGPEPSDDDSEVTDLTATAQDDGSPTEPASGRVDGARVNVPAVTPSAAPALTIASSAPGDPAAPPSGPENDHAVHADAARAPNTDDAPPPPPRSSPRGVQGLEVRPLEHDDLGIADSSRPLVVRLVKKRPPVRNRDSYEIDISRHKHAIAVQVEDLEKYLMTANPSIRVVAYDISEDASSSIAEYVIRELKALALNGESERLHPLILGKRFHAHGGIFTVTDVKVYQPSDDPEYRLHVVAKDEAGKEHDFEVDEATKMIRDYETAKATAMQDRALQRGLSSAFPAVFTVTLAHLGRTEPTRIVGTHVTVAISGSRFNQGIKRYNGDIGVVHRWDNSRGTGGFARVLLTSGVYVDIRGPASNVMPWGPKVDMRNDLFQVLLATPTTGKHSGLLRALVHGRPAGLKRNENTVTVVYDDKNKHPAEIKDLETIKELARNSSIQWLAHKPKTAAVVVPPTDKTDEEEATTRPAGQEWDPEFDEETDDEDDDRPEDSLGTDINDDGGVATGVNADVGTGVTLDTPHSFAAAHIISVEGTQVMLRMTRINAQKLNMDSSEGHEQVRNLVAATVTTTITSCSEIPSTEDEQDPGEVVVRAVLLPHGAADGAALKALMHKGDPVWVRHDDDDTDVTDGMDGDGAVRDAHGDGDDDNDKGPSTSR